MNLDPLHHCSRHRDGHHRFGDRLKYCTYSQCACGVRRDEKTTALSQPPEDAQRARRTSPVTEPLADQLETFLTKIPNRELLDAFATVLRRRAAALAEGDRTPFEQLSADTDSDVLNELAPLLEQSAENLSC